MNEVVYHLGSKSDISTSSELLPNRATNWEALMMGSRHSSMVFLQDYLLRNL